MESIRTAVIEKLRFFRGWMIYLPFLMLVMCNYVDQYFITFQGGDATKAYTLCMTVYWIIVAIGSVISIIMSTIIRSKLAIGNVEGASKSSSNALFYTVIFSVFNSVIVFIGLYPLVNSFPDPGVTRAVLDFLEPILILNVPLACNLVLMGILAALGHKRKYIACIFVTFLGELTFNPFFIFYCKLGAFGNGLGTAMSLSVTCIPALYWILRGKTQIRISWKLVDRKIADLKEVAVKLVAYVIQAVSRHVGELIVRLQLYLVYSLTYGIPMLYASFILIFGSGTAASTACEYRMLFHRGGG